MAPWWRSSEIPCFTNVQIYIYIYIYIYIAAFGTVDAYYVDKLNSVDKDGLVSGVAVLDTSGNVYEGGAVRSASVLAHYPGSPPLVHVSIYSACYLPACTPRCLQKIDKENIFSYATSFSYV